MLTLLEEVVLLAVDEASGQLVSAREGWTEYALAGAVLFDLALAGRIDSDIEAITVVDATPTGSDTLDRILARMGSRRDLATVRDWIEELVCGEEDLEGEALNSLTARAILRHEKTKRLWFIDLERFSLTGPAEQQYVKRRLARAILTDEIPETRDIMLVSLAEACGLLSLVVSEAELQKRKARIQTLCNLETISRKVTSAIRGLESLRRQAIPKMV
jgi:golgi phosphoprotein 3